jgi:hypothetical protein
MSTKTSGQRPMRVLQSTIGYGRLACTTKHNEDAVRKKIANSNEARKNIFESLFNVHLDTENSVKAIDIALETIMATPLKVFKEVIVVVSP